MTKISPLLQSRLNATPTTGVQQAPNNRHEKIYQDLQQKAHEAKPNEAKAKMVKEGILGNPITAIKDTFQDGANFVKAVRTGKMGDNSLGRINDLGLKIGAGLIATFLAANSKTKTDAIMRFIGGGTFIAAMSLWPKLFINLPARLVHGFRIDNKYVSAQGDKKDFFLDNQFLVWDAYPEEQLKKDAKNAGIDYDSKNGKEKIQRKMQKTALQNRTLWMATAGFATPLMTAMVGNFVEPKVKDAVIKHDFKKVQKIVNPENVGGIAEYLQDVDVEAKNVKQLDELFESYKSTPLDDEFYGKLAEVLVPEDFLGKYRDDDDLKVFDQFKPDNVKEALKNANKSDMFAPMVEEGYLRSKLKDAEKIDLLSGKVTKFGEEKANEIIKKLEGNFSAQNVRNVLQENGVPEESMNNILSSAQQDNTKFFDFIREFNEGPLTQAKARIKKFADLVNPAVGSKSESVYTKEITGTLGNIVKVLGIENEDLLKLRKEDTENAIELLSNAISSRVKNMDDEAYEDFIKSLAPDKAPEGLSGVVEQLRQGTEEIFSGLIGEDTPNKEQAQELINGILGKNDKTGSKGIADSIRAFIDVKNTDLSAIKSKAIMCANFERRLANGELDLTPEQIKVARKAFYDGTISTAANMTYVRNSVEYKGLLDKIFDESAFKKEIDTFGKSFKDALGAVYTIFKGSDGLSAGKNFAEKASRDYMACGSFAQHMANTATRLSNNKAWMKIFAPMAIALVGVTLLAQPFFGNIKKEFPEENGGAK